MRRALIAIGQGAAIATLSGAMLCAVPAMLGAYPLPCVIAASVAGIAGIMTASALVAGAALDALAYRRAIRARLQSIIGSQHNDR